MKLGLLSANIRDSDVIKTHQNKCIALKTKLNELNFGSNCLECQIGCLLPYSAFYATRLTNLVRITPQITPEQLLL